MHVIKPIMQSQIKESNFPFALRFTWLDWRVELKQATLVVDEQNIRSLVKDLWMQFRHF